MNEPEEIPIEEAAEKLRESDRAVLVTLDQKPVPTLGDVDISDQKIEITTESFMVRNDE